MNKRVKNYLLSILTVINLIFTDLFLVVKGVVDLPSPQTGDDAPTTIVFVIMGIAVAIMITLLIVYLITKKNSKSISDEEKEGDN